MRTSIAIQTHTQSGEDDHGRELVEKPLPAVGPQSVQSGQTLTVDVNGGLPNEGSPASGFYNGALTMLSVSTPEAHTRHESGVSDWVRQIGPTRRLVAGFQYAGEVTAMSHDSGTRRTREDSRGHDTLGD